MTAPATPLGPSAALVPAAPAPPAAPGELGVYVHVPFCRRRCDYCAFATFTDRDHLMGRYVAACVAELDRARAEEGLAGVTSLFFGGGTPSRLAPSALARLVEAVPLVAGATVTVECNPEDASPARFDRYRRAGVTRLSLGVQSTVPHVLEALGRRHSPERVPLAVAMAAEAGIPSLNVDLIYGAVGERDEDWARTLDDVLGLPVRPHHVSAYALTVEPGTPLAADPARHPDDDVQARRYERAVEVLEGAGYEWEEVSNWALPGHGSRHNRLYWRQGDYRGIGAAAHSHAGGRRWWNVRTPERYIRAVEGGGSPVAGEERLDPAQQAFERLMLSLRTPAGVPDAALAHVAELDGLVERREGRAVLTVRGRLLANAVTRHLRVPEAEGPRRGAGARRPHGAGGTRRYPARP